MSKADRQMARLIREERYRLRRKNDEHDLRHLPWWQQRTGANMLRALIRRWERR